MNNHIVKLTLFYCSNSLSPEEISTCINQTKDLELNTISLPCSGKVNIQYLLKTIETGSDGVMLATCKFGECKFVQGNFRAEKRVQAIDELLEESGLKKGHIKFVELKDEKKKIESLLNEINNLRTQLKDEPQLIKVKI